MSLSGVSGGEAVCLCTPCYTLLAILLHGQDSGVWKYVIALGFPVVEDSIGISQQMHLSCTATLLTSQG